MAAIIQGHVQIVGTTECGKTTAAKIMARRYKAAGIGVGVLDPQNDPEWGADFQTRDPAAFLKWARESQTCALFLDETSISMDRHDSDYDWFAVLARQWGHRSHFIGQRQIQVNPTVRAQCSSYLIFRVDWNDAKELALNYTRRELMHATELNKGEFLIGNRFNAPTKCRLDFERRIFVPTHTFDASGTPVPISTAKRRASKAG